MCLCEVPRHAGADLVSCTDTLAPDVGSGFCYVSAESDEPSVGNPELVEHCPEGLRRRLVITGSQPGSATQSLLVCQTPP
jgi:hypothetical protein